MTADHGLGGEGGSLIFIWTRSLNCGDFVVAMVQF